MHITFVLNQELEGASTLGRHFPLAKELVKLGHTVRFITTHPAFDTLTTRVFRREGVEVLYVGQMHIRRSGNHKTYMSAPELIKTALASTWHLFRHAIAVPTDAFQICKSQPMNGLAALMAGMLRRKPVFLDSDDFEDQFNHFTGRWQRVIVSNFEKLLPRLVHAVTTHTCFNIERMRAYGVPADRLLHIPNGIDRERFANITEQDACALRSRLGFTDQDQVIAYVGNMSLANHPIDLLLASFKQTHQHEARARLLMVGGGEDYDAVQAQVADMGLAQCVHFTGRIAPEDVPLYFKLADVSVEPVNDDLVARARSPLKVFESMAVGTPVVAGDVGDRRAILGEAGVLVTAGDAEAMATGLLSVLQTPHLKQQLAQVALARREQFYWDNLVHDFEKVYAL